MAAGARALPTEVPERTALIAEAETLASEAPADDLGDKVRALDARISLAELPTTSATLARAARSVVEDASALPTRNANRWPLIERANRLSADARALSDLTHETPPSLELLQEFDALQRERAELAHAIAEEEPARGSHASDVWKKRVESAAWDAHDYKHTRARTTAEAIEFSTPNDTNIAPPSQYAPDVDVPALEREALMHGTPYKGDPNVPGSTVFLRYEAPDGRIIGYDGGTPVSTMRVEITASNAFHGHPRDFNRGR